MAWTKVITLLCSVHILVVCSAPCQSDLECSLLGHCADGVCQCDQGWTGPDCGQADLMPWNYTGYLEATSWGGRPVLDNNGTWHLYFSYLNGCPLGFFSNTSSIKHAVSDSIVGNFTIVEEVIPPFAHNPTAQRAPDGTMVMYYIGRDPPVPHVPTCQSSHQNKVSDCACMKILTLTCSQVILQERPELPQDQQDDPIVPTTFVRMATAPGFSGPWDTSINPLPKALPGASNPAVWIHPNGSAVMVYRFHTAEYGESLGVATAPHWTGPFKPFTEPFVTVKNGTGDNEDPFLFKNARGYHVITHNQGPGCVCKNELGNYCGAHLFSEDLLTWTISKTPVYTGDLVTVDGTTLQLTQRQRPQLVVNSEGRPLALFTGGSFDGKGWTQATTHTIAVAFK